MADTAAKTTAEKPANKKTAKKESNSKMWLGGLVLIILVLGGVNFYYMKKNKDLQIKLDKKKGSGVDLSMAPDKDTTTSSKDLSMAGGEDNSVAEDPTK